MHDRVCLDWIAKKCVFPLRRRPSEEVRGSYEERHRGYDEGYRRRRYDERPNRSRY